MKIWLCTLLAALLSGGSSAKSLEGSRPNIVLVITDDQGMGDLSCMGNQVVKTPHIDRFHDKAVRFRDFQVSPTCAPTRAAIMSGRAPFKSGVTHTIDQRERKALDNTLVIFTTDNGATHLSRKLNGKNLKHSNSNLKGGKNSSYESGTPVPAFIGLDLTATPYYAYVTHKPKPGWQTPDGMGIPVYDPSYGRVPPQVLNRKPRSK